MNDELRHELDLPSLSRAKLDAHIAYVYALTEEEFRHILATFPLVKMTLIK